jgi:hypothetical protein
MEEKLRPRVKDVNEIKKSIKGLFKVFVDDDKSKRKLQDFYFKHTQQNRKSNKQLRTTLNRLNKEVESAKDAIDDLIDEIPDKITEQFAIKSILEARRKDKDKQDREDREIMEAHQKLHALKAKQKTRKQAAPNLQFLDLEAIEDKDGDSDSD